MYVNWIKIVVRNDGTIKIGDGSSSPMIVISKGKRQKVVRLIMKKCENILTVELDCRRRCGEKDLPLVGKLLSVIATHCHSINHFKLLKWKAQNFSSFKWFIAVCGDKLKKLELSCSSGSRFSQLSCCIHVQSIVMSGRVSVLAAFKGKQGLFPKRLTSIEGSIYSCEIYSPLLASFIEKYKNCLVRMKLRTSMWEQHKDRQKFLHLLSLLNRFTHLQYISLHFWRALLSVNDWNEMMKMRVFSEAKELIINDRLLTR